MSPADSENTRWSYSNQHVVQQSDNFLSSRIVNEWNELPKEVVDAPSINAFKNRLDRHWNDMGIFSWLATLPINLKYKYK